MTPLLLWIITLAIAYLIGSIPTGYLLVRTFQQQDVRETGSGTIGATNVARAGGTGLGIATLVLDVLKGVLAVVFAQHMAQWSGFPNGYELEAIAGLFAVLGHIFSVWLRFSGGKGVATALGVFFAMMPLTALAAVVLFAIIFAVTRYVSLASIVGAAFLGIASALLDTRRDLIVDLVYLALPVIVIAKHHGNISRLLARTEPKFGVKSEA